MTLCPPIIMRSWLVLLTVFVATIILVSGLPPPSQADDIAEEYLHPDLIYSSRRKRDVTSTRVARSVADLSNELTTDYWNYRAQSWLKAKVSEKLNTNKAKNIILFLGDGLSTTTVTAARIYLGQMNGKTGEEESLFWEDFPYAGLSKTYCINDQVADSACTSTAYLCGIKTNRGVLGLNAKVNRGDCDASLDTSTYVTSIAEWALDQGKSSGIVTTTRVTHASPAGAYAHTAQRDWESDYDLNSDGINATLCPDIATQLITQYPGKDFQVILGGGRREFLPNTTVDDEGSSGRRLDGIDLIETWKQDKADRDAKYGYLWNRKDLQNIIDNPNDIDYVLGLFENTHCQYQKEAVEATEPTLSEMTEAAIKILQKNSNGFFLFVEGGRIDQAHHDSYANLALDETVALADAVSVASRLTNEDDTLIVVTADHAHVMTMSGYPERGNDILGIADDSDVDGLPFSTLSYANGPGYREPSNYTRYDMSNDDLTDARYQYPAMAPRDSETHGGDDVSVHARGPWSHLFSGTMEQNRIPHFMAFAACIGKGLTACNREQ